MRQILASALVISMVLVHASSQPPGSTASGGARDDGPIVYLVRHAERSPDGSADPSLTDEGRERAQVLAHVLGDAEIASVFVSQFKRTQETASPIADALDLEPVVVPDGDPATTAARIGEHDEGGAVLVIGHSNTIPKLIGLLGIPGVPDDLIPHDAFDRLFVVTPGDEGPVLLRLRYGAPSVGTP